MISPSPLLQMRTDLPMPILALPSGTGPPRPKIGLGCICAYLSHIGHRPPRLLERRILVRPHLEQVNTFLSLFHIDEWQAGQYLGGSSLLCTHSAPQRRHLSLISGLFHLVDLHEGHLIGVP